MSDARTYIGTVITKIFHSSEKLVTPANIKIIVDLYDLYIFDKQIYGKLEEMSSTISFVVKSDDKSNLCYATSQGSGEKYTISISEKTILNLVKIYKKNPEILENMLGNYRVNVDECVAFQLSIEHQLIHLIMAMWGFLNKKKDEEIYGPHGKLFDCLYKYYFNGDHNGTSLGTREKNSRGKFQWYSNSCYMDSLLMILFASTCEYYRKIIFNINLDDTKWPYVANVCSGESKIRTEEDIRSLAKSIQGRLREDFNSVISKGETIMCTSLRNLFRKCLPDMKQGTHWNTYEVAKIYDAMTELFPPLKISYEAYIRGKHGERYSESTKTMFQMWDFMDPLTNAKDGSEKILWEVINYPILVFQNGVTPPIIDFGSLRRESYKMRGYRGFEIHGEEYSDSESEEDDSKEDEDEQEYSEESEEQKLDSESEESEKLDSESEEEESEEEKKYSETEEKGNGTIFVIEKARKFEEYIIDNRYRLFGIINVHGSQKGKGGGAHYTCYVRDKSSPNSWYSYDDMGPTYSNIGNLPEDAFREGNGKKPEMFFYELYNESKKVQSSKRTSIIPDKNKALVVCANADKSENYKIAQTIIGRLNASGYIRGNFELISVNPEIPTGKILFDKHIAKRFCTEEWDEKEKYDVIFFQHCMSCLPNVGEISIFYNPLCISMIYNLLNNGGYFLNIEGCYYDGKSNDIRIKIQELFDFAGTIQSTIPMRKLEIWKKNEKSRHTKSFH